MKPLLILAFMAGAAQAQQVLSGDEFDALSQNTTMYFTEGGVFFGAEQFLPDRRSIWRAQDGSCVNGKWEEVKGDICFIYDNGDGPHCWQVSASNKGLTITSTNNRPDRPPTVLELAGQDTRPILCTGPKFGF